MDKIIFHHAPMSPQQHRALDVRGAERALRAARRRAWIGGDHKKPEYLAINPVGKVPAITHQGVTITEAAAICAYLADEFPAAKLAVPVGTPQRGLYLKWLFYSPSCLEQAMIDKGSNRPPVPPRQSSYGDYDTVMETVAQAVEDGPYLRRRAVHRRRRRARLLPAIRHHDQGAARAAGVRRLSQAADRAAGACSARSPRTRRSTPGCTRPAVERAIARGRSGWRLAGT